MNQVHGTRSICDPSMLNSFSDSGSDFERRRDVFSNLLGVYPLNSRSLVITNNLKK